MHQNDIGALIRDCPQERGTIRMMGKSIPVPRFQEPFLRPYYFSGQNHPPRRDPLPIVTELLTWLNSLDGLEYADGTRPTFNACLANWYLTGDDYIGAHADDEGQLKQVSGGSFVACVSYGHPRTLRIRDKRTKKNVRDVVIPPNSLYVMCGKFQKRYRHEFPKSKKVTGPRVSFTFREFVK